MEGPIGRAHLGREGAPCEGIALHHFFLVSVQSTLYVLISGVMVSGYLSGLISRAMPRDGLHGDSKERPLMTGSIMQGNFLINIL